MQRRLTIAADFFSVAITVVASADVRPFSVIPAADDGFPPTAFHPILIGDDFPPFLAFANDDNDTAVIARFDTIFFSFDAEVAHLAVFFSYHLQLL